MITTKVYFKFDTDFFKFFYKVLKNVGKLGDKKSVKITSFFGISPKIQIPFQAILKQNYGKLKKNRNFQNKL